MDHGQGSPGVNRLLPFAARSPSLAYVSADGKRETGQEVLLVDGDKNVLRGLERLFTDAGLTVSGLTDPARARDQVEKRFIPVVVFDLDTPTQGAGIEFVRFARERAPLTAVILMTARKGFEAIAPAFRAGATDVIPKTQDCVPYLRERVVAAAREIRSAQTRDQLLVEVVEIHEAFLKKMMELSRTVTDLEDKILSRDGENSSSASGMAVINLLIVDDEPALNAVLVRDLPSEKGWRIRYAQSGGEALDSASQTAPQILVVNETLPDLPASMVIKSIKGNSPDAVALMFTPPEEGVTGEVRMVDSSRLFTLIPAFKTPSQLVASLEEVREALRQKAKERRYLQVFRKQHFDFLKRYNALKARLAPKT
jgi:DNA-binding NtrC family response regulator